MQHRMKQHPLNQEQISQLLAESSTGTIGTINEDGSPYLTPVHFVYYNNHIYLHGLPKGQKIDNIQQTPSVCFSVYQMSGLLLDENEKPCDTNTQYQSVIMNGQASILTDLETKQAVLKQIVEKYTPHLTHKELPINMIKGTAVIEIAITELTGKYY